LACGFWLQSMLPKLTTKRSKKNVSFV